MRIYLLRHGESAANVERVFAAKKIDPPLSDTGTAQITSQARNLKPIKFEAAYASPLLRARQTADIVRQAIGLDYRIDDSLREMDVGFLDGQDQNDPELWAMYENTVAQWRAGNTDFTFPEGESAILAAGRFKNFLNRIENRHDGPVLVVAHCLLYMVALWYWHSNKKEEIENYHMGRGHYSIINKKSGKLDLIEFNVGPV
ncbi:MAG: histidine phosphatase family protein [Deltaproteobacteria bacterium]|nr:histidine phosphatase family protein [Deltaproteobacteria bacterium]